MHQQRRCAREWLRVCRRFNYSANKDMAGAGSWAANLKEAIWHSFAYTMSIDVFVVSSTSARIVVVAYCFMVMIISNTCAAGAQQVSRGCLCSQGTHAVWVVLYA